MKQTPVWYDYFANPGSTVYVYKTQNVDDTIVKTTHPAAVSKWT